MRHMRLRLLLSLGLAAGAALWLLLPSASPAYEGGEVAGGGTIRGRVVLDGPVPEPRVFPMVLYPFGNYCKKISDGNGHVLLREFNVDAAGGLQDAVVAVQGVARGKRFAYRDHQLVTIHCMFHPADVPEEEQFERRDGALSHVHPLVSVMRNHWPLSVINQDPIAHGAQIYQQQSGHRVLSFPIPPASRRPSGGFVHVREGLNIVQIICPMHEYMQSWGWIVDNPYYEKTRRGGEFVIEDVPPGAYTVTAWHPHLKPLERRVTVPPRGEVTVDFIFDARRVVRPIYETQAQFRIPPESDPFQDLKGCEGPFCVTRAHDHQH
ncbi:MAG: carboxypeptidase-like regulatory domain-containing protein [Nitrospirota bacterium]